jgi:hypothetical protein
MYMYVANIKNNLALHITHPRSSSGLSGAAARLDDASATCVPSDA